MSWIFIKGFFSKKAWLKLYSIRKLYKPEEGVRTKLAVFISLILSVFLIAFIISNHLENKSSLRFLKKQNDVVLINKNEYHTIFISSSMTKICSTDIECYDMLKAQTFNELKFEDLFKNLNQRILQTLDTHLLNEDKSNKTKLFMRMIKFNINLKTFIPPYNNNETLGLIFPHFAFNEATLFINGIIKHKYFESEFIHIPIKEIEKLSNITNLTIDIVLYSNLSKTQKFLNKRGQEIFISSYKIINQYKNFVKNYDNYYEKIGGLSRIILALFCLFLFLIIDSSPESLGLAFFMGFEAAGMSLGWYGMRISWLPLEIKYDFLQHYFWAMGDIFRLYFLLQLARVVGTNIIPWLIIGSMYSIPYAYLRHIAPEMGYDWVVYTWVWRDLFVAIIGSIMCIRTAILIRGQGLKWREYALWLASFATSAQILHALFQYFPNITGSIYYINFLSLIETNSAYFFALSTFINISTLENRVKRLSSDIAKNKLIEQELELGHKVQQEFLKIPPLPKDINLNINYKAQAYVSGDTYFIKFNEFSQVLTVILIDIQGHGIQAALKASASNMIARTLWDTDMDNIKEIVTISKLVKYDQLLPKLLNSSSNTHIGFVGLELNIVTGVLYIYRSNYNFPIIFQPSTLLNKEQWNVFDESLWRIKPVSLLNKRIQQTQLYPGAMVLLLSDGYINSSQHVVNLTEYLQKQLIEHKYSFDTNNIKKLIMEWDTNNNSIIDDKTLIVLSWQPTKIPDSFKHQKIA